MGKGRGNGNDERRVVAPMAGRVRGLRDIRTLGSLPTPAKPRSAPPSIGARIRVGTATPGPPHADALPERPRTWVFVRRPRFSRHQGRLLVDRMVEPEVDVFEEGQSVLVLAELPGVRGDEVDVQVNGDVLTLSTMPASPDGLRHYRELLLPFAVSGRIARRALRNGVLELELLAASPPKARRKS